MADMICPDTKCRYYNTDETNHCKKHKHCGVYCTYKRFTGDLLCPACIPLPSLPEPQPLEELDALIQAIEDCQCVYPQKRHKTIKCNEVQCHKCNVQAVMQVITEQEQAELQAMREALEMARQYIQEAVDEGIDDTAEADLAKIDTALGGK